MVNDNSDKKHHYNNKTFGKTKDPSKPATLANPRNAPAEKIMIAEKQKYTQAKVTRIISTKWRLQSPHLCRCLIQNRFFDARKKTDSLTWIDRPQTQT